VLNPVLKLPLENFSQVYIYDRSRTVELNNRLVNLTAALIKANLYIYDVNNRIPVQTFIETSLRLPPAVSAPHLRCFFLVHPPPSQLLFSASDETSLLTSRQ
jgi:hypothetical protein